MDPSKFAGMSWDVWANFVESCPRVDSKVQKLQEEDKKIFGVRVDAQPVEVVVCEVCGLLVKPQALLAHYEIRHPGGAIGNSHKESSEVTENNITGPIAVSSLADQISGISFVKDVNVGRENIENVVKPVKRSQTNRSPLLQVSNNKLLCKRKIPREKNKSSGKNCLTKCGKGEKMESSEVLCIEPGMSSNSVKDDFAGVVDTNENISNNLSFLSSHPRALSMPQFFSHHKAGGLFYPGRHMKVARENLQNLLNGKVNTHTKLIQRIKARRKNINH